MTEKPSEKRRKHNVQKAIKFFSVKQKSWDTKGELTARAATLLPAAKMAAIAELIADHGPSFEILLKWVNTHRQAAREMTADDFQELQDGLAVRAVQES